MIKFKSYNEFINESVLPYEIVQYDLASRKWVADDDIRKSFLDKHPTLDDVRVFINKEEKRNLTYLFTSWKDSNHRVIELQENGKVVFMYKYIDDEKRDFKQDYLAILGKQYK
jgi:hypothetical protein